MNPCTYAHQWTWTSGNTNSVCPDWRRCSGCGLTYGEYREGRKRGD
jgi:hypothetical protein